MNPSLNPFTPTSPWLAALLLALIAGPSARAQQAPAADATPELAKIVVTASRGQALVEQMPLYTTIVTQEEIRKAPAQTLDQLLREIPGMNFTGVPSTQSDPTGQSTKMRGLGTAKVLVLLDGVPILDPFYLTTQWFKAPLSNIERIEVIRGGNSSLWGNMAVAGVVNIVSKRARNNDGEAGFSLGSRGSNNLSLSKNFLVSEVLSFNLALDQLNSKGYAPAPADQMWHFPARGPVNAKDSNLQFTTFVTPAADLKGYLRLGYHIQDQAISYQYGSNLQKSPDFSASLTKQFDNRTSLSTTAWAQYVNFEKYNGATCYWQTSGTTKCPSSSSVSPAQVNNQVVQYYTQYGSQRYREQGASGIYSKQMEGVWESLQLGVDYRHLSATDTEFFYSAPTTLSSLQNLNSSTQGSAGQTFTGLFAQTRVVPVTPLELTFSARLDNWLNSGRINTRTTAAGLTTGGPRADSTKTAINPSMAAKYSLSDTVGLRAAAYKSFRAPGFNNTTRTFGSPNPTIANPDLGPENLFGRELGLDYASGPVSVSATLFQYDIKDMIATYKVNSYATAPALVQTICGAGLANCSGSASFYTNDQDGRSRGLELAARWKVQRNLSLDAAFTRTSSVLTRVGSVVTDPIGTQIAGTPWNVAHVGVSWQPQSRWSTYLQAHYIGRMFIDTTSTPGVNYVQGGSTVWDASAMYALSKDADLSLSVANLGNKVYSENAYTFTQPWNRTLSLPRTVTVGAKFRF